jgi:hypothetical protein
VQGNHHWHVHETGHSCANSAHSIGDMFLAQSFRVWNARVWNPIGSPFWLPKKLGGAKRRMGGHKGKWGAKKANVGAKRQMGCHKGIWGAKRHVKYHKACGVPLRQMCCHKGRWGTKRQMGHHKGIWGTGYPYGTGNVPKIRQ